MTDRQAFERMADAFDGKLCIELTPLDSVIVRILIEKGFLTYDDENDTIRKGLR